MGFLPEVNEKDALEYAEGLAEKYLEQMSLVYFDAFRFSNGYVYEVHEGGRGRAFFPEIKKFFEEHAHDPEIPGIVVGTATRNLLVELGRNGVLSSVILPENSKREPAEWLQGTDKMQPALSTRTGFLVVSALVFVTGFSFMIVSSLLARYVPPSPPAPVVESINVENLPFSQFGRLIHVSPPDYVEALVFENGNWSVKLASSRGSKPLPPSPPSPPLTPVTHK
jgi:hypothetical protein